jgi:glycosyltransferase involved in cell wall biosynthesis
MFEQSESVVASTGFVDQRKTEPIRIALIVERLNASGMARDLSDLCAHLDRNRFTPMVISLLGPGVFDDELRATGATVTYAGCGQSLAAWQSFRALWRLGWRLRRERIRIVHGSHYWSSIYAVVVAKMAGARAVTNRIDLGFCASGLLMRWLVNASNLGADAVVANCDAVRKAVLDREAGVAGKLKLIYNSCDCERAASGSASADRGHLGMPAKGPIILNVANLHSHKRQEWLLGAAPGVLARFPDATFVLVGKDMGQLDSLRRLAADLHIERSVIFTGVRHDVFSLLAVASVGTLTSETEACSNTLLEYCAAGLPVVATNVGGNAEIVVHGVSGFLVQAGDLSELVARICELLEKPEHARQMGSAGRELVQRKFSIGRAVGEYEELFLNLAGEPTAQYQPESA